MTRPRRLILRRDLPIVGTLALIAAITVAAFATGAVTRLRVAWLARDGSLTGPIRIADEETLFALMALEPVASDYLIAHAEEVEPADIASYVRLQRVVLYRAQGVSNADRELAVLERDRMNVLLLADLIRADTLLVDAATSALTLEQEYGITLAMPPAVAERVARLRAHGVTVVEGGGAGPPDPSAGEVIEAPPPIGPGIDWDTIFGRGAR